MKFVVVLAALLAVSAASPVAVANAGLIDGLLGTVVGAVGGIVGGLLGGVVTLLGGLVVLTGQIVVTAGVAVLGSAAIGVLGIVTATVGGVTTIVAGLTATLYVSIGIFGCLINASIATTIQAVIQGGICTLDLLLAQTITTVIGGVTGLLLTVDGVLVGTPAVLLSFLQADATALVRVLLSGGPHSFLYLHCHLKACAHWLLVITNTVNTRIGKHSGQLQCNLATNIDIDGQVITSSGKYYVNVNVVVWIICHVQAVLGVLTNTVTALGQLAVSAGATLDCSLIYY